MAKKWSEIRHKATFRRQYEDMWRAAQEINGKLLATDPRFRGSVYIVDEDGSQFFLRDAFAVYCGFFTMVFCEHQLPLVFVTEDARVDAYLYDAIERVSEPSLVVKAPASTPGGSSRL